MKQTAKRKLHLLHVGRREMKTVLELVRTTIVTGLVFILQVSIVVMLPAKGYFLCPLCRPRK